MPQTSIGEKYEQEGQDAVEAQAEVVVRKCSRLEPVLEKEVLYFLVELRQIID